jgi:outer membrane protein assembly factor BamB
MKSGHDSGSMNPCPRRGSAIGRLTFRLWAVLVVIGLAGLLALHWLASKLVEIFPSFEPSMAGVATAVFVLAAVSSWLVWLVLLSGWPWRRRLTIAGGLVGLVAACLALFQPIFGGGMDIRGWRPRFWQTAAVVREAAQGLANLTSETPGDFPQFLGPARTGIVEGIDFDPEWNHQPPELLWRKPIGAGWSGFATRNGFAVTMQQVGETERVTCLRVDDGAPVWEFSLRRRYDDPLGGIGPRSTPTIDGGRVYALGALGTLVCLDGTNGELIWQADLLELAGISVIERKNGRGERIQVEQSSVAWGRSASPLVDATRVIVPCGGNIGLVAFDKFTGSVLWTGGEQPPGYGSPTFIQIDGQRQIAVVNESSVSGHDPSDGRELWRHRREGNSNADANTSQPVDCGDNRVLVTKGYGLGGEMLRVRRESDGSFAAESIWKSNRVLKTKLTNAVVRGDYAYAISSEVLECVDLRDGTRVWRADRRAGHGQLLLVGRYLLVHSETGALSLVEAMPSHYSPRGEIATVAGICWNTVALYGDKVLVRSDVEAACFRLPTTLPPSGDLSPSESEALPAAQSQGTERR